MTDDGPLVDVLLPPRVEVDVPARLFFVDAFMRPIIRLDWAGWRDMMACKLQLARSPWRCNATATPAQELGAVSVNEP